MIGDHPGILQPLDISSNFCSVEVFPKVLDPVIFAEQFNLKSYVFW